jgi:hypothetical protein
LEALVLQGNYALEGAQPVRFWKQGYQSWWWSGVTELSQMTFDDRGLPVVGGDGNGTSAAEETPYSSWWNGLVGREDGQSLLIGALDVQSLRFWTAVSDTELWAVWGGRTDSITISPNAEVFLDPIWIKASEDAFALHREYAQEVANYKEIEMRFEKPPTGWATWYTFYEDIDEDVIMSNLDAAIALRNSDKTTPIEVFQIDDGWQKHWGEWESNEHFPSGMAALATEIKSAGFTPGLWMAPFYVSTEATIYSQENDWWVRDENGEPILFSNFGDSNYAIIDVTNPDAAQWMKETVAAKKAEGWEYLKLDFLYAGAQSGQRMQDVTGMEAYHVGMNLLREAVGDGLFLACGAPMLPSVGYADAFRTGADIGFNFDPGPRHEYLRWQVRATAARSWQNGVWWWIDPDQILLREPFSEAERNGALVANVVSGGAWLLGDDLSSLNVTLQEEGMAKALVNTRGSVGVPVRWELSDGSIALINMSSETIEVSAPAGVEYFSQNRTEYGDTRTLVSGQGEIWLAADSQEN